MRIAHIAKIRRKHIGNIAVAEIELLPRANGGFLVIGIRQPAAENILPDHKRRAAEDRALDEHVFVLIAQPSADLRRNVLRQKEAQDIDLRHRLTPPELVPR